MLRLFAILVATLAACDMSSRPMHAAGTALAVPFSSLMHANGTGLFG